MFGDIIILLLAVPVGYLIAWLARDELIEGQKWFYRIMIVCLFVALWSAVTMRMTILLTCLFILIVAHISYLKSKDKNWAVKRRV